MQRGLRLGGLWRTNYKVEMNLEKLIPWSRGSLLVVDDLIERDTDILHFYNFGKYFSMYFVIGNRKLERPFFSNRDKGQ